MGMPTASRRPGTEIDPASFGAIYEGLCAANLMNPALDKRFEMLKKHRSHKLELFFRDHPDDDHYFTGPWKREHEPQPSPDFQRGYANAWYAAACERCGKSFVSKEREQLRSFEATSLTTTRAGTFFDGVIVTGDDLDNPAAPLTSRERYKLGMFLWDHRAHGVRVALLRTSAERKAFLPRTKRGSPRKQAVPPPVRNLEDWWTRLEQSGWLAEVSESESSRIREAFAGQAADLSQAFHVLSPAGFDAECIDDSGDYERWVISAYSKASTGAFTPTKVKDRLSRRAGTATISFQAGGRKFSTQFSQEDDWIADEVHDFLNEALAALGEKRRFHLLPTGDQTGEIVCVRPETYQRAVEAGLIPEGA